VTGETLATGFQLGDGARIPAGERDYSDDVQVEGLALTITLRRVVNP